MNKKKGQELNVLVIEDNLGDYFLLEEYLNEALPSVVTNHCQNLENAVSFLEDVNKSVSIIFSDLNLPDASNIELVSNLLQYSKSVPVILLSGYENKKIIEESKKLGAFDFLCKDNLNPVLLKEKIERAIQKLAC